MRTYFSILFLTLLLSFTDYGYGQDWIKDTCYLKGPVKSLVYYSKIEYTNEISQWDEERIEYNEQGFMIRHNRSSSWGGENFNAYYRKFDKSGNLCLVAYDIYDSDTSSWTEYFYNERGIKYHSKYYSGGRLWNTANYEYNHQYLLIKKTSTTIQGSVFTNSYKYDEKGRMIYHEDLSSTVKKFRYWKYNESGLLLEEKYIDSNWATRTTHYMGDDREIDSTKSEDNSQRAYTKDSYIIKYTYDSEGRMIEKIRTEIDGTLISKNSFTYNEYGDEETEIIYNAEKDKSFSYKYEFEYDKYKNWTIKKTFSGDKLFREETQEILYY